MTEISHNAKVLIFDIETSDIELIIRQYGLKNYRKYFDPDEINRDWTMLGAAWKWLKAPDTHCVSIKPESPLNDYGVCEALYKAISEADILIGHNSDRFDIRKMNARFLKYGLPPIGKKQTIDTLKIARKYFDITSNKLSYLAEYLELPILKGDPPDWKKVIAGDEYEIAKMRVYNKDDVRVTEALYLKLLGWHDTHPNMRPHSPIRDPQGNVLNSCPSCGSLDTRRNGYKYTTSGKKQNYQCKNCGRHYVEGKTTIIKPSMTCFNEASKNV